MSLRRFDRLRRLHERLDAEIRQEMKTRMPDGLRLFRLKRLKLAIKDRLFLATRRTFLRG